MSDLRYAFRSLRRSPAFALVVVASLALGIGANTALFSLVNRLLIQALPVREPDRLVHVQRVLELGGGNVKSIGLAAADIETLARNSAVFSDVAGFLDLDHSIVVVNGTIEPPFDVQQVLPGFFDALGVSMTIGTARNDVRGAVISHRYWRARFGGNTDVLRSSLNVDGQSYPILGVAPPQFQGLELETSPNIWIWSNAASESPFVMVGRLRSQVGPTGAEIAMSSMFQQMGGRQFRGANVGARIELASRGISLARAEYGRPLVALLVLAALVLLTACANVGILLAVRNAARTRELAVRVSIGARRSHLFSQLLVEGAVLAVGGAVLALPVARAIVAMILSTLPGAAEGLGFRLDLPLLSFVITISLLCILLFAAAPAWRATCPVELAQGLQAGRAATLPRSTRRSQRMLVAAQASLSMVILVGTGLFLQTLRNLSHADLGFDSRRLLQVLVDPRGSGYQPEQIGSLYRRLTERFAAIPGVESVTGVRNSILHGRLTGWPEVEQVEVGPAFFETMRIPLVKGHYLAGLDHTLAGFEAAPIGNHRTIQLPSRVVISESLARRLFGRNDPIGQRLPEPLRQRPVIVGVVRDARFSTVRADPRPAIYVAVGPEPDRFNAILIRTSADPSSAVPAIQEVVQHEHPRLMLAIHTMRQEMDRSIARERMVAAVSALFGSLGLVLVGVGIFGVAAYTVARRTNELGIRIALGASSWDVIRESLAGTLVAFIAGLIAGVVLALAGIRLVEGAISGLLYELTPSDSRNIVVAVGVMLAAAIAASVVPAYRAVSVDPNSAIRSE